MAIYKLKRNDLIEPELSYKIVGVLFRVYNELGPGLHEKYYQKAAAVGFQEISLPFKMEVAIPLAFSGIKVGRYFADFIVADKIIIELKTGSHINRQHAKQLLAYLKATKLSLGILVYFGSDGVSFKRIINHS
jgi:GxxExxY protein